MLFTNNQKVKEHEILSNITMRLSSRLLVLFPIIFKTLQHLYRPIG